MKWYPVIAIPVSLINTEKLKVTGEIATAVGSRAFGQFVNINSGESKQCE